MWLICLIANLHNVVYQFYIPHVCLLPFHGFLTRFHSSLFINIHLKRIIFIISITRLSEFQHALMTNLAKFEINICDWLHYILFFLYHHSLVLQICPICLYQTLILWCNCPRFESILLNDTTKDGAFWQCLPIIRLH